MSNLSVTIYKEMPGLSQRFAENPFRQNGEDKKEKWGQNGDNMIPENEKGFLVDVYVNQKS
jgi:hypothetical protein